jgi:CheY-like chemotaxis protein
MSVDKSGCDARSLELARVLLVDDDVTSRLTLQTVLEAGGYWVDVAASAAEALGKLDEQEYELVLSDLGMESPEAGLRVLAHARLQHYQPATALVTAYQESRPRQETRRAMKSLFVETEDLAGLLGHVADLIGLRATRRLARSMRQASLTTS